MELGFKIAYDLYKKRMLTKDTGLTIVGGNSKKFTVDNGREELPIEIDKVYDFYGRPVADDDYVIYDGENEGELASKLVGVRIKKRKDFKLVIESHEKTVILKVGQGMIGLQSDIDQINWFIERTGILLLDNEKARILLSPDSEHLTIFKEIKEHRNGIKIIIS